MGARAKEEAIARAVEEAEATAEAGEGAKEAIARAVKEAEARAEAEAGAGNQAEKKNGQFH